MVKTPHIQPGSSLTRNLYDPHISPLVVPSSSAGPSPPCSQVSPAPSRDSEVEDLGLGPGLLQGLSGALKWRSPVKDPITSHYIRIYIYIHTLHYVTVQYITLYYITLHYITVHYIHVCICICVYMCVYLSVYVCVRVCLPIFHICMYTCLCMHACMYLAPHSLK